MQPVPIIERLGNAFAERSVIGAGKEPVSEFLLVGDRHVVLPFGGTGGLLIDQALAPCRSRLPQRRRACPSAALDEALSVDTISGREVRILCWFHGTVEPQRSPQTPRAGARFAHR